MIALIDYGTGNIRSVENALRRANAEYILTSDVSIITAADRVILPGVGDASVAMGNLVASGLADIVKSLTTPVLGICVGMQIMCRHSDEGDVECLGIFDSVVRRFDSESGIKIPHVGWNTISELSSTLFNGIAEGSFVYYVHSYYSQPCACTIALTEHGIPFSGALSRDNFYGVQFHPEKSGETGAKILDNFLRL